MTKASPVDSYVRRFLLEYLISDRGLSRNTQKGYRDVIRLLLWFLESAASSLKCNTLIW
jgi:integrase/recombinase XerD